jgi:hypothetical protein
MMRIGLVLLCVVLSFQEENITEIDDTNYDEKKRDDLLKGTQSIHLPNREG